MATQLVKLGNGEANEELRAICMDMLILLERLLEMTSSSCILT